MQLCKGRVDKYTRAQTEQSIRFCYWKDWDRDDDRQKSPDDCPSYSTTSADNNYTIWSFLKRRRRGGFIYRGREAARRSPGYSIGLSQVEKPTAISAWPIAP